MLWTVPIGTVPIVAFKQRQLLTGHTKVSFLFVLHLLSCLADYVKSFGYDKVLEARTLDLRSLEVDGIFVPQLGTAL